jgi:hypothetical protein
MTAAFRVHFTTRTGDHIHPLDSQEEVDNFVKNMKSLGIQVKKVTEGDKVLEVDTTIPENKDKWKIEWPKGV